MICLKTVWKESQNSYSNRYISGTNWNFKAVMNKQIYKSLSFEL